MSDQQKRKKKREIQPTLVELQAEINRDLAAPLSETEGLSDAIHRVVKRESLVRQYIQQMFGGMLLQFSSRSSKATRYHAMPNLQKMRSLLREPGAPEHVDTAYLHTLKSRFSELALAGFRQTGRGALVIDLTTPEEENQNLAPSWHPSKNFNRKIRAIVADYNPEEEFVVAILRPGNDERIYRVRLR